MIPKIGNQVWVTGGTHTGKRGSLQKVTQDTAVIAFENGSLGSTHTRFVDISYVEGLDDIAKRRGTFTKQQDEKSIIVVDETSSVGVEVDKNTDGTEVDSSTVSSSDDTRLMSEDDDASIPRYETETEKLGARYARALAKEDTDYGDVEDTLVRLFGSVRFYREQGYVYSDYPGSDS